MYQNAQWNSVTQGLIGHNKVCNNEAACLTKLALLHLRFFFMAGTEEFPLYTVTAIHLSTAAAL
jgi:hypothetical protein